VRKDKNSFVGVLYYKLLNDYNNQERGKDTIIQ
jgi:hypothetical protein